uniref:Uncharacterized protein n=1 Tax=Pristionchus pacificus TaxID=54126 RepID=A0A2A6BW24_PRIPA|eukprot:PDM70067.1 hypothetical protein PRIPAC_49279 [Pristionchus pacificus]
MNEEPSIMMNPNSDPPVQLHHRQPVAAHAVTQARACTMIICRIAEHLMRRDQEANHARGACSPSPHLTQHVQKLLQPRGVEPLALSTMCRTSSTTRPSSLSPLAPPPAAPSSAAAARAARPRIRAPRPGSLERHHISGGPSSPPPTHAPSPLVTTVVHLEQPYRVTYSNLTVYGPASLVSWWSAMFRSICVSIAAAESASQFADT